MPGVAEIDPTQVMKNKYKLLAGAIIACAMFLVTVSNATSSNEDSKNREHHSDSDDDGEGGGAGRCRGTVTITSPKSGGAIIPAGVLVKVRYKAPANSGAKIVLLENGVAVGTYVVPANKASGFAYFIVAGVVGPFEGLIKLQAQLCFSCCTGSGGDDDDDDRSGSGDGDDGDDDEGGCVVVTAKCVLSNVVLLRPSGN